ncbi:hypothetical protein IM697_41050 [Streptomyces ferrugineus]|uniref:Uncharacterized protein n=1 Tax=Streptomyces ferrugineus TaxID=1413221 RepID=A0A7M2SJ83_9ACTN|nr:DUF6082 family protein [Streptomyces ferrugineus]QOV36322.1 hypothetical protein IM697_41050 [Streptomyces ferrugineus]
MTVPNQSEPMLELLQQAVQQFGRMADGYQRIADELHRANAIRLQSLFLAQLTRAMDDPVLAETLSGWPDLTEDKRRQLLNANAQYGLILLTHRVGIIDRSELLGHLKVLRGNAIFAEYWQRTAWAREHLPPESFEARVGRAVDAVMDERLDDLEEWWVVGPDSDSESPRH